MTCEIDIHELPGTPKNVHLLMGNFTDRASNPRAYDATRTYLLELMAAHIEVFEQVALLGEYEDHMLGYHTCFEQNVNG